MTYLDGATWVLIIDMVVYHPPPWTPRDHWDNHADNCSCCRSRMWYTGATCTVCDDARMVALVSRGFLQRARYLYAAMAERFPSDFEGSSDSSETRRGELS